MKTYLAAAILLASVGAAWAQAVPSTPDLDAPGTMHEGATSAIPQPPTPKGMRRMVVPDDPLGSHVGTNSFVGGSPVMTSHVLPFGNRGIVSPSIR